MCRSPIRTRTRHRHGWWADLADRNADRITHPQLTGWPSTTFHPVRIEVRGGCFVLPATNFQASGRTRSSHKPTRARPNLQSRKLSSRVPLRPMPQVFPAAMGLPPPLLSRLRQRGLQACTPQHQPRSRPRGCRERMVRHQAQPRNRRRPGGGCGPESALPW